ncbi:MAG: hypothetical protein ACSHXI_02780 [Hoeflea sp.]|uniref:hypothetical protein n=1 Tax=Hoeflea sp. TaxID=1940281 RepID=UPI003EF783E9
MKTTLAILTATTALAAFLAMPAVGADHSNRIGDSDQLMTMDDASPKDRGYLLASNDDDDHRSKTGYGSDDDDYDDEDYDDEDEDDDEDDDDDGGRAGSKPVPAGSVSPPDNGLFDTGAASQVQVN